MFLGGLATRRLGDFEGDTSETIGLEFTLSKKVWLIIFAYSLLSVTPINNNKDVFFSELSNSLNRAAMKYDNF